MTGALLARVGDKAPVLEVLGSDRSPVSTTLPGEPMTPSFYGDLVAVATDTAVVMFQTQGQNAPKSIRALGPPEGGAVLAVRPSAVRRAGRRQAARARPVQRRPARRHRPAGAGQGTPRRSLRAVAPGPAGRRRLGLDHRRRTEPDERRRAGQVERGPAGGGDSQHAAGPSRQGRGRARPGRQGHARSRPGGRRGRGRMAPGALAARARHRGPRPTRARSPRPTAARPPHRSISR